MHINHKSIGGKTMKGIKGKSFVVFLLVIAMTLVCMACSNNGTTPQSTASNANTQAAPETSAAITPAPEPVTLTVWLPNTFSKDADAMLQARCEEFAANNSDRVKEVKVEFVSSTDGYAKWNAAIESGEVPDITFLHSSALISYSAMDVLEDLTDLIAEVEQQYSPMITNHKDNLTINGKICTLPLYAQICAMTYRTDLLEQAGYTEPPTTWTQLKEVAKAITDKSGGVYGMGNGMGTADDGEDVLQYICRSFGMRMFDKDGNITVNSPEMVNAIKFLAGMYQDDKSMPPSVVEWDASGNNKSYLAGECAIAFNPPTLYNATQAADVKDTLGVVTSMSAMPKGDYDAWTYQNYIMMSIFKNSEHKDLAKELLKTLLDPEWYENYMELNFPVAGPVFEKTIDSDIWQSDIAKKILPQSYLGGVYGEPCKDMKVMAAEAKAYNEFVISKTMQKVLLTGMTPENAVAELEQEIQQILSSVQ
jgi:multiple sugar transport system substrate-binding protein